LHIGLLDHSEQRLFRSLPWFEKGREVAALAQLRDRQFDRARPRAPTPGAIAVAPLRWVDRDAERAPRGAPVRASTSMSISRSAAKASISRTKSLSDACSTRSKSAIFSSVIVGSSGSVSHPNPIKDRRWQPQQPNSLLHHPTGHSPTKACRALVRYYHIWVTKACYGPYPSRRVISST
jgi:hypothetical protein